MEVLYWLESIRNPVMDTLMLILTEFGNELLFIVFGILMLWCVDKRQGYYVLLVGFFGIYINQFLKITCRIPRPWVLDPNFSIVEAARAAATGYSFPSGHTQIAVGCYAGLALCRRERWVRAIGIALAILIPITRMYLGVHTPLDVGVSILIALVLVFILWHLLSRYGLSPRLMFPLMGILSAFGAAFLLYTNLYSFPTDIDPVNHADAVENGFKFLGCTLGMWCMYLLDRYRIRFDTKTASVWAQVLKLSLGFVLVVGILEGSKPLWHLMLGDSPVTHVLRYFLTVIFAGVVWPLTFPWFARIGVDKATKEQGDSYE